MKPYFKVYFVISDCGDFEGNETLMNIVHQK